MFKINNHSIEITSGDTVAFSVEIENRQVSANDSYVLTVKEDLDGEALITKQTAANGYFVFYKEDTENLEGRFYYDISYCDEYGNTYAIIKPSLFIVKKGVS